MTTPAGMLGALLLILSAAALLLHAIWAVSIGYWVHLSVAGSLTLVNAERGAALAAWSSKNDTLTFIFTVLPAEALTGLCAAALIGLGYSQSRCCAVPPEK